MATQAEMKKEARKARLPGHNSNSIPCYGSLPDGIKWRSAYSSLPEGRNYLTSGCGVCGRSFIFGDVEPKWQLDTSI